MNEIDKLKTELEKARSQLYIFYELTKAMRTTLHLEEIAYIILTGLTARQGLGFNRAILFLLDKEEKNITGFMGIGPMDNAQADNIWRHIEEAKKNLYDLIANYHSIKEGVIEEKFMEFTRSLSFSLSQENSILSKVFYEKSPIHIKTTNTKDLTNDPLVNKLRLEEFICSPLWIKGRPSGLIVVDNCVTKKPIREEEQKIFSMFAEQAAGAIGNSQAFEDTLIKASTDSLTSLWNYRYFQHQLDKAFLNAQKEKHELSLMMIDIDDFKKFNDTHGHLEGDAELRRISKILKQNCRKMDVLCRYGGEEFSLILPHTNKQNALYLGERMKKCVEEEKAFEDKFSTISIGIASYPNDALDNQTIIRRADEALYQAKRNGKNKVILTQPLVIQTTTQLVY